MLRSYVTHGLSITIQTAQYVVFTKLQCVMVKHYEKLNPVRSSFIHNTEGVEYWRS